VVERGFVLPPASRIGPATPAERAEVIKTSVLYGHYENLIDRESAYEKLKGRAIDRQPTGPSGGSSTDAGAATGAEVGGTLKGALGEMLFGSTGPRGAHREGLLESVAKSAARTVGSQIGREVIRGVLGSILGGGKRR